MSNTVSAQGVPVAACLPARYELRRFLGQGGMGTVWGALDRELDRLVAVKVLHGNAAAGAAEAAQARARFMLELRITAQLEHPHIVRLYDFGRFGNEEEQLYFTMELLPGRDLSWWLAQNGKWPLERIAQVCVPIARGLDAAHRQNVLHRDLKPSNIMLADYGGEEVPKILDFGVAKVLGRGSSLTHEGLVLGSAPYIPAEIARGIEADARADLYSLGVILFELAAGRKPFLARDADELLRAHAFEPAPALRSVDRTVSARYENLVSTLLSKEPSERPTASEVAELLLAMSHRKPSWRPPTVGRSVSWRRAAIGAGAVVFAGAGALGWSRHSTGDTHDVAPRSPALNTAAPQGQEHKPPPAEDVSSQPPASPPAETLPSAVGAPVYADAGVAPARPRIRTTPRPTQDVWERRH